MRNSVIEECAQVAEKAAREANRIIGGGSSLRAEALTELAATLRALKD